MGWEGRNGKKISLYATAMTRVILRRKMSTQDF